jgi:excisionase family DNA binding protein
MKFITIKEAADIIGVTRMTLRNWDKNGKLKAHRHPFNNYRVYKVEDIEALLEMIDLSTSEITKKVTQVKKLAVRHLEEDK